MNRKKYLNKLNIKLNKYLGTVDVTCSCGISIVQLWAALQEQIQNLCSGSGLDSGLDLDFGFGLGLGLGLSLEPFGNWSGLVADPCYFSQLKPSHGERIGVP